MSAELDQLVKDLEAIERFEATYAQTMPRVKRDLKDRIRSARAKEQRAGVPSGLPCSSEALFNEIREAAPDVADELEAAALHDEPPSRPL